MEDAPHVRLTADLSPVERAMTVGVPKGHLPSHHIRADLSAVDICVRRERPLHGLDIKTRTGERFA